MEGSSWDKQPGGHRHAPGVVLDTRSDTGASARRSGACIEKCRRSSQLAVTVDYGDNGGQSCIV